MKAECPLGHSENLSYEELLERLMENDFSCRGLDGDCSKNLSYEVDERFWNEYLEREMHFAREAGRADAMLELDEDTNQ